MRTVETYDYAVIRVVPRVEREEFLNAGVILSCPAAKFLEARIELDAARVAALDPGVDIDIVRAYLAAIPAICAGAGPIGALPPRSRFHWLTAQRSSGRKQFTPEFRIPELHQAAHVQPPRFRFRQDPCRHEQIRLGPRTRFGDQIREMGKFQKRVMRRANFRRGQFTAHRACRGACGSPWTRLFGRLRELSP